jgi:gamma-D-glutamyl-L-lysine dipeptidyl-peptidase
MGNYICENVFVPLRSGPTHRSEMLSQVLFGEKYHVIDQSAGWLKIETLFDNYQGWIDKDHLQHSEASDNILGIVLQSSLLCFKEDKSKLVLEPGSEIYNHDFVKKTFIAGTHKYTVPGDFNDSCIKTNEAPTDTALRFINSPYIWGGRIPSGIDCSGFTQLVYKMHGMTIPRNSWQQASIGETVSFINDAKPGDLAFFDNEKGNITHVGMIFSEGLIIHASGRVRIDTIDHQGIYKQETGGYSHHLRTIRRIVNR